MGLGERKSDRETGGGHTSLRPPSLYYCGNKRGGDEVFGMRWHIKSAIVSRRHWNMDVISLNKPAQLRYIRNALLRPGKSYLCLSPSLLMQRETLRYSEGEVEVGEWLLRVQEGQK